MESIGTYKDGYSKYFNKNLELKNDILKMSDRTIGNINTVYNAGDHFTNQYCPIFDEYECIQSLKSMVGDTSVSVDGKKLVRAEVELYNGGFRKYYSIEIGGGRGSSCIFFDVDGEFVVRDYNHDLVGYKQVSSVLEYIDMKKQYFLDNLKKEFGKYDSLEHCVNKNDEHIWFTPNFAYRINDYSASINVTLVDVVPYRKDNKYFYDGNSGSAIRKPKKVEVVDNQHPIQIISDLLSSN